MMRSQAAGNTHTYERPRKLTCVSCWACHQTLESCCLLEMLPLPLLPRLGTPPWTLLLLLLLLLLLTQRHLLPEVLVGYPLRWSCCAAAAGTSWGCQLPLQSLKTPPRQTRMQQAPQALLLVLLGPPQP